jgi:multidrug efflux pump subunit AcrA (membrane-fusion protein)
MTSLWRNKGFLILAVLVAVGGFYIWKSTRKVDPVIYATAEKKKFLKSVMINGSLEPVRKTIVIAPFNGFIRTIHVKVGQSVKAGDPVVTLTQSLSGPEPIHPIRAGISGRVVQVMHGEGEYMKADDATNYILRIDDQSKYYVDAYVPELSVTFMAVGQAVSLTSSALPGKVIKGKIKEISEAPKIQEGWRNQGKVEYLVRIELIERSDELFSGLSFAAEVITNEKENAIVLPLEFLFKEGDQYFVMDENQKKVPVVIGMVNDHEAEILSGLNAGARVRGFDMMEILGDRDVVSH